MTRKRSNRAAITAAVLAVAAMGLVPHSAPAALSGLCQGTWTSTGSCTFPFAGPNFFLGGTANASSSPQLTVKIIEVTTNTTLASCSSSGNGTSTSCSAGGLSTGPTVLDMPAGVILRCQVTGRTSGSFFCQSST